MQRVGEEVARILRLRGYASRTAVWSGGECEIIAAELGGEVYAVTVARHGERLYGKVVPGSAAISIMRCDELMYSPWGLYVFAGDAGEMAEAVGRKLRRLAGMRDASLGGEA